MDPNTIPENVFVCSDHFKEEVKGAKKLKSGAVPSILVPAQSPLVVLEAEDDVSRNSTYCAPSVPTILVSEAGPSNSSACITSLPSTVITEAGPSSSSSFVPSLSE